MKLVSSLKDIEENAFILADALQADRKDHIKIATLISKGRAFFPFYFQGRLAFAPSRFIGYKDNSIDAHFDQRSGSDGKITNRKIDGILGSRYVEDVSLHAELEKYARSIGVEMENRKHRFWPVESAKRHADRSSSATDDIDNDLLGNDDPDYQKALRGGFARSPKVRKAVLKRADGRCEYCGSTSFQMSDGTRYLETHHILALSKKGPDRVGNVIALCANDHRAAHFGKDWKARQAEFSALLETKVAR